MIAALAVAKNTAEAVAVKTQPEKNKTMLVALEA